MNEMKKDIFTSKTHSQKSTSSSDNSQIDLFTSEISTLNSISSLIKQHQLYSLSQNKSNIITTLLSLQNSLTNTLETQRQDKKILEKNVKILI